MQRAEDPSSRLAAEPERSGLRPAVAFLLLLVVIAIIGVVALLTRADPAPPGTTESRAEPTFALTDEEAITRFEELAMIRKEAYASRDISLLTSLYTSDSLVGPQATRELRKLNRDGVSDLSEYETRSIRVVSNAPNEITLREVVIVRPRFVADSGKEVTVDAPVSREIVEWTLRPQDDRWLIHDALITASEPLR